jgi:cell wall-associated NlpC family hydrolase
VSAWWAGYVGLPFRYDGRTRDGLDCWGLVRLAFTERAGIGLPSYGEIPAARLARVAERMMADSLLPPWTVATGAPRELDVVLMTGRTLQDGRRRPLAMHVGVMIDARRVLHVEEETAAVAIALDHPSVRRRVRGLFRHEDLS